MFNTPILLLVFNKTDTTLQVFERIKAIKPTQLFVAGDGPRENNPEDVEKCATVRKLILDGIDWECEVKTLFRENNLGCGRGPASAITWFFTHVEKGIILEDDCLPVHGFFHYCAHLLNKYEKDPRIMHISGHNPVENYSVESKLLFSKYSFIWGWATWAKSWEKYEYSLTSWATASAKKKIRSAASSNQEYKYWKFNFDKYSKEVPNPTWDYQWQYALFMNDGISVVPTTSFIQNKGIGHPDATHTTQTDAESVQTPKNYVEKEINLNSLTYPIVLDQVYDAKVFNEIYVHWLPKFNMKVFVYKFLPEPLKRALSVLKMKN